MLSLAVSGISLRLPPVSSNVHCIRNWVLEFDCVGASATVRVRNGDAARTVAGEGAALGDGAGYWHRHCGGQ
jgi:hypothetical protein